MFANYSARRGAISDYAMDWGEEVTFTRRLDKDLLFLHSMNKRMDKKTGTKQDMQNLVHNHPWMRLMMPFIKTPVNILKFPLQRTPFILSPKGTILGKKFEWVENLHMRFQADMASGDPLRVAEAEGRVVAGKVFWFTLMGAAASGITTGAGPSNPRERNTLMATGWRPYSVRVGDKYISYSRLDPFALPVGLSADMYERFAERGRSGDVEEDWMNSVMLAGAYSLSNNIADKSYLAGINNVLQALIDPEHKFEALIKKQVTSYVPKFGSQWTPITDDHYMKKTYGLLEAVMQRVPGLNREIEPMRNLLGDPLESMYEPTVWAAGINPFLISKATNDPILNELANVGYGFGHPEPKIKGSRHLDMRKFHDAKGRSAFDRFQELVGVVTYNNRTVHQALAALYDSKGYKRASDLADKRELRFQGTYKDARIKAIKSVMAKFRAKAKAQTVKEYPNLGNAIRAYDQNNEDQMRELLNI